MKGYSYALVILLLCIFTAGCMEMIMSEFQEPLGSVCTSPAARALESSGLDQDHCYQQVAVNAGDLTLCNEIKRGAPMTKCYLLIAVKYGDSSICNQIPSTSDPQAYLPIDCLWEVALKTNDPAVCAEMGTTKISRMFIGEISQETCTAKVGGGTPQSLQQMYTKKSENFRQCQDLAYAAVFNKAPSITTGSSKQEVGEKLLSSSYTVTSKGCVAEGASPSIPLSDGDIIVFDWDTLPDPKNGAHYAVVEKGKISQILNFAQAGAFNQTNDIAWFFSQRTVYDPYNNNQPMTSPKVYHCYTVYHKTSGSR
jgi:hypothetical protein